VRVDAGGGATYAKIEAARNLGLTIVMVRRPDKPDVEQVIQLETALAWIEAHRAPP